MNLNESLAQRFEEVYLNGRWIANTNFQDMLRDVSLEEANTQIGNLNTIGLLSFHIHYYIKGILDFFENGQLTISDAKSFDAPRLVTEEQWSVLKENISQDAELLSVHIRKLNEDQLHSNFVKAAYGDYARNINGLIEHAYYHLGQIALLKKMIKSAQL